MSRDGHTLSWKATGVLATEHLSLERGLNTSQHVCVSVHVSNYLAVFFSWLKGGGLVCHLFYSSFLGGILCLYYRADGQGMTGKEGTDK